MGSCVVIFNHTNKQYISLSYKWGELFGNKELMAKLLDYFRNEWYNSQIELTTETSPKYQQIKQDYFKVELEADDSDEWIKSQLEKARSKITNAQITIKDPDKPLKPDIECTDEIKKIRFE